MIFPQYYKHAQKNNADESNQIRIVEVIVLKILMHMDANNYTEYKELYDQTNNTIDSILRKRDDIQFYIPFGEIVGIMRGMKISKYFLFHFSKLRYSFSECSGRINSKNNKKTEAMEDFLEAFDFYELSASARKEQCKEILIEMGYSKDNFLVSSGESE